MKKVSLCRMVSSVALSIGSVNVYLYASDTDSMRVDAQDETFMGTAVKTSVHESLGRVHNNQKNWTIGGKIGLGGSIALLALGGLCLCFIATPIGCVMSILMIAFGVILMPVSFQFGRRDIQVNNAAVAHESVPPHHDVAGAASREPSPDVSNSMATVLPCKGAMSLTSTIDARGAHAPMPEPSYAAEGKDMARACVEAAQQGDLSDAAEGKDMARACVEAAQQGDLPDAAEGKDMAHACTEAAQQGDLSYAAEGKDMARACVEAAQKGELLRIREIYDSNCPIDYQGHMTALMFAVIRNHVDCVEFLVDKEAGKQDVSGWTALIYAVYQRSVDFVTQKLIEEEYHLKAKDGKTALSMAEDNYRLDGEVSDSASDKILKRLREYAAQKEDPAISDAASKNISPAETPAPMPEYLASAASDEQDREKHTEQLSNDIDLLPLGNNNASLSLLDEQTPPVSGEPSPKISTAQPQSNTATAPDDRSARIDGGNKLLEYVNADQLPEKRDIKAFEQPQSSPETASDDRFASTPNKMEVPDDSAEPLSDDSYVSSAQPQSSPETASDDRSASTPNEMGVQDDSTEQLLDDSDVPPLDNALRRLLDEQTPPVSLKPSPKTSVAQPQSNPATVPDARSARIDGMNKLLEYVNADQLPARDIEALLAAAEKAYSIREEREDIYTALCIAAARIGDEDMLRSLSEHKARIDYNQNAKTALMWLAEKQPDLLLKILKELQGERQWVEGNDVVIEDEMFKAQLKSSAFKAKLQSRDFTLYADSNLSYLMQAAHDKVDDNGMNALMYAVKSGNLDLVRLLLAASMYEYMSSSGYDDARRSPFWTQDRTVFAYATDKDVFQFLYEAMNNSVKKMQTQCAKYPKALEALKIKKELEAKGEDYKWSSCPEQAEYKEAIAVYDKLAKDFEEVLPYHKDVDGHTLMIYAARSRNRDIVNALKPLTIAQLKKAVAVELKDAFKSAIVELFKYDEVAQCKEAILQRFKDEIGTTLENAIGSSLPNQSQDERFTQFKDVMVARLKDAMSATLHDTILESLKCAVSSSLIKEDAEIESLKDTIVESLRSDKALQLTDEMFKRLNSAMSSLFGDIEVATLENAIVDLLPNVISKLFEDAIANSLELEEETVTLFQDKICKLLKAKKQRRCPTREGVAEALEEESMKSLTNKILALLGNNKILALSVKAIENSFSEITFNALGMVGGPQSQLKAAMLKQIRDEDISVFNAIKKHLCQTSMVSSLATTMVEALKEKREKTLKEAIVSTLDAQKAALLEKIVNTLRKKKQVTSLMACLYTDLMLACMGGDVDSAQRFLSEAQEVDQTGRTALMYAAMFGQDACVQLLLKKPQEAKLQDKLGMTALMHAAAHGHQDCVKLLLKHECGVKDYFDNTALWHALRNGHLECVDLLFNKEEDKTQLSSIFLQAIFSGNVQIVDKILNKEDIVKGALGNDPVNACLLLESLIQQVMAKGYDDVAVSLWQCMQKYKTALENITDATKEAKLAIRLSSRLSSMTPLMYAAQVGNEACISRFIEQVGQKDAEGKTALMYAVIRGDIKIVKKSINWLLEAEAGIQDNDGKTAFMYYVGKYSSSPGSVLEAFVRSKDAGKTDTKGESALSLLANKWSLHDDAGVLKGLLDMLDDILAFNSLENNKENLQQALGALKNSEEADERKQKALETLKSSEEADEREQKAKLEAEYNARQKKLNREAAYALLEEKLEELEELEALKQRSK